MPRLRGCNPSPPRLLARANNMVKYVAALAPPPAEFDSTVGFSAFQMFLNDEYGDCTEAENGNAICGLTAASRGAPVYIGNSEIRKNYLAQSPNDSGIDIATNLAYEDRHGLVDENGRVHQPGPYGTVDASNIAEFATASYYFGRLKLGIATPSQFYNAANNGVVDWPAGHYGGQMDHCVLCTGRQLVNGKPHWKIVTWGGICWVNDAFIVECCGKVGEAWAVYNCPDRLKPEGVTIEGFREADLLYDWAIFKGLPLPPQPTPPPVPPDPSPDFCAALKARALAVLDRACKCSPDDPRINIALPWLEGYFPA